MFKRLLLTLLVLFALAQPANANWWAMQRGGGGSGTSWATWDETTESGWGDPTNNLIWILENPAQGGNETGQGGGALSGADLVLTQNGDISGATGTPPRRIVSGPGSDYFSGTATTVKAFFNGQTFSYITKATGMSAKGGIVELYDGTRHLLLDTDGRFYTAQYTVNSDVSWATDPSLPTGDIYFAFFDSGTTTYWGWSATKPTKLSDFPAGQIVQKASINGTQDVMTRLGVFGSPTTSTTLVISGEFVVFSHLCLIDTAN